MGEYEMQAKDFLKKTGTKMSICKKEVVDRFPGDNRSTGNRWKYRVTLSRNHHSYTTDFYDSVANYISGKRPTQYDVLSCLESYEVDDDPWRFADEFGYEIHSSQDAKEILRIHKACQTQYKKLKRLFGGYLDELQEIR